jgi:hypothetical protein
MVRVHVPQSATFAKFSHWYNKIMPEKLVQHTGEKQEEKLQIAQLKIGDVILADSAFFADQIPDGTVLPVLTKLMTGHELDWKDRGNEMALACYYYGGIEFVVNERVGTVRDGFSVNTKAAKDYWPVQDGQIFREGERMPSGEVVSRPWVYEGSNFKFLSSPGTIPVIKTKTDGTQIREKWEEERKQRKADRDKQD